MERALALQERREPEAVIARPEDAKQLKRAQVVLAIADGESVSRIAHSDKASRRLARSLEIALQRVPVACPELNPVESLWRWLKGRVLSNSECEDFGEPLRIARDSLVVLPRRDTLRLAGVMSDNFWLGTYNLVYEVTSPFSKGKTMCCSIGHFVRKSIVAAWLVAATLTLISSGGILVLAEESSEAAALKILMRKGIAEMEKENGRVTLFCLDFDHNDDSDVQLLAHFPRLRTLWIACQGKELTRRASEHLSRLRQIRHLAIGNTTFADHTLRAIGKLKNLRSLRLSGRVRPTSLRFLTSLRELEALDLSGTSLTDEALVFVSKLGKLKRLDLSDTSIKGDGVKHLAALRLRDLRLVGTMVRPEVTKDLSKITTLVVLDLSYTKVDDESLKDLLQLPKLRGLGLEGCSISDRGLRIIGQMKSLRFVTLFSSRITRQGINALKMARPKLRWVLDIPHDLSK